MSASDKKTAGIGKGTPGPGRPKGQPNKITKAAREAFELAFVTLGGVEALTEWARENQSEFYKLYARLIPVDTNVNAGGKLIVEIRSFGGETQN